MTSYVFDIGFEESEVAIAIGDLHAALQRVFICEREVSGLTQKELARRLKVNKSVVSRQLNGFENLTYDSIVRIALAMGYLTHTDFHKSGERRRHFSPCRGSPRSS